MQRVVLNVEAPGDVLNRVYPNGKLGGLTIDGPSPGTLGELVVVEARIADPRRSFAVKGQLAWVRHKGARALKECFGVDFVAEDEAATQRLLAFARNEVEGEALRAEPRVATDFPVSLVHRNQTRKEHLADLSTGGAFVRTTNPLLPGEAVTLHLRPRLSLALLPIKLQGRVAWVRKTGTAQGMGIEFAAEDIGAHQRLLKLLAKLGVK